MQNSTIPAQQTTTHSTFVLDRNYPAPPQSVFDAFADPAKKRRWFAESQGHDLHHFDLDFRIGGTEHFSYRLKPGTPVAGLTITNESRFHDIVPERRIISAATMDLGEQRILISLVTIDLLPTLDGTDLVLTHQGIYLQGETGLTPQMLQAGWRTLLDNLHGQLTQN